MSEEPANVLYQKYLDGDSEGKLAERLWGSIPRNSSEYHGLFITIRDSYGNFLPHLEALGKAIRADMRRLGVLTPGAERSIERLDNGAVETGQQPNCLGGPSFIFNKITFAWSLTSLGGDYVPLYFVGDYDGVQAELTNIRVPSPSSRGMLISYPVPPGYEAAPIRALPLPGGDWIEKTLEKLESNYRGLLKGVELAKQERVLLNLSHIATVIKEAYYSTDNVGDFSTKIIGVMANLEGGLGVPILQASDPKIRWCFQSGYEFLLADPQRSKYISASNEAVDLLDGMGFRPQIGRREMNYVPFFLECETPTCHGARVEMKYSIGLGSEASISGKCGICGEEYDFSFDASKPDLSEVVERISPRVDSRQIVVDSVVPIVAHVGGPGETSYYAEVIPGAAALGVPFPAYARYTRVYYNTPWCEVAARELKAKGYETLLDERLFDSLAGWVNAKKRNEGAVVAVSHAEIKSVINTIYSSLVARREALERDVSSIKSRLGDPSTRDVLLKEIKSKQAEAAEVDSYLSMAFGHFAPEKQGQEVSWAWIDFALSSGVKDMIGAYRRLYGPHTPNSSTYYVNL